MTIDGKGYALRWDCPECGAHVRGMAQTIDAAEGALLDAVREHCQTHGDRVNAYAQATGWLAAAGHLVELWGGPFDGDRVWCPPGALPMVVGVHRTADGTVVPVRAATAQSLAHVDLYVSDALDPVTPGRHRYVWTP